MALYHETINRKSADAEMTYCSTLSLLEILLFSLCVFLAMANINIVRYWNIEYFHAGVFDIDATAALITALVFMTVISVVVWIRRRHHVVVVLDERECGEIISSERVQIELPGDTCKLVKVKPAVIPTLLIWAKKVIQSFLVKGCLLLSWFVVFVGRVRFEYSPTENAPSSLYDEWSYDLENINVKERLPRALYLLPDSISIVCEFGSIGRIRKMMNNKKKCICGAGKCECDVTAVNDVASQ